MTLNELGFGVGIQLLGTKLIIFPFFRRVERGGSSRATTYFLTGGVDRVAGPRPRRWPHLRLSALLAAMLVALAALVVPMPATAATGDVGVQDMSHSGT